MQKQVKDLKPGDKPMKQIKLKDLEYVKYKFLTASITASTAYRISFTADSAGPLFICTDDANAIRGPFPLVGSFINWFFIPCDKDGNEVEIIKD